ncbi:tubulin epsilon and delta complex protein 2 isoform X2 [Narcine bancroftii]|uniref:tubulin epsilon and delta complex protein 2 isoform X2 n=1 Tax=Narcine bancroftii TaxID=1343680 RepID=UPI00383142E8
MLPADGALRLSRVLAEGGEQCSEEERRLQQEVKLHRKLLTPWNPHATETLRKVKAQITGGEELKELEVLNKALAKALRIRQTHHKALESELFQPDTLEGSRAVAFRSSETASQPAMPKCNDQYSSSTSHKFAKMKAVKVGAQVVASKSNSTDGLGVKKITARSISSMKMVTAALKAPYKTDLVGRRRLVSSTVARLAHGSLHTKSRADETVAIQQPDYSISASRADRTQHHQLHSLKKASRTFKGHDADPGTDSTPQFIPVSQPSVKSIKQSGQLSASKEAMPQSDTSDMETPKLFTLQSSGSTLQLPPKWRKQYRRNTCLWEKVSKNKAVVIQERSRFMERIQSAFHSQLPTVSNAEVEERLNNIHDLYRCISQCLYTDPLLDCLDPVSWQQECERIQILERCQEVLPNLLHQIQQLKDVVTFWMNFGNCWRPAFKACRDVGSEFAPLLLYSSLHELKEMETLKFQVYTLQQQIHIQKAMAEELLPVLFSASPEQSQSNLYRAVYSLLCEGGERFPALVLDNIPD